MRNRRLYCDMDGVAADFDTGYERAFGSRPSKVLDNVDWSLVRTYGDAFYRTLPVMPDFPDLWAIIACYRPWFLTGVPERINAADNAKRDWLAANVGQDVPIICCPSKDKALHCQPGDILIDDWEKYRAKWEAAGGIWITHTSAASTITKLLALEPYILDTIGR